MTSWCRRPVNTGFQCNTGLLVGAHLESPEFLLISRTGAKAARFLMSGGYAAGRVDGRSIRCQSRNGPLTFCQKLRYSGCCSGPSPQGVNSSGAGM